MRDKQKGVDEKKNNKKYMYVKSIIRWGYLNGPEMILLGYNHLICFDSDDEFNGIALFPKNNAWYKGLVKGNSFICNAKVRSIQDK